MNNYKVFCFTGILKRQSIVWLMHTTCFPSLRCISLLTLLFVIAKACRGYHEELLTPTMKQSLVTFSNDCAIDNLFTLVSNRLHLRKMKANTLAFPRLENPFRLYQ